MADLVCFGTSLQASIEKWYQSPKATELFALLGGCLDESSRLQLVQELNDPDSEASRIKRTMLQVHAEFEAEWSIEDWRALMGDAFAENELAYDEMFRRHDERLSYEREDRPG